MSQTRFHTLGAISPRLDRQCLSCAFCILGSAFSVPVNFHSIVVDTQGLFHTNNAPLQRDSNPRPPTYLVGVVQTAPPTLTRTAAGNHAYTVAFIQQQHRWPGACRVLYGGRRLYLRGRYLIIPGLPTHPRIHPLAFQLRLGKKGIISGNKI